MDLPVALTTFGLIFLAELGDKSQLTAMTLAARHPWRRVFLGAAAAFLVLNLVAVAVGRLLFELVPPGWVQLAAGLLFLFFGVSSLRSGPEAPAEEADATSFYRGPAITTFVLILLAEFGDKTQLVTAGLAARHGAPWSVFVGSTLALWAVSLLGVVAGDRIARRISLPMIHRIAGLLFLLFGAGMLVEAWAAIRGE